MWVNFSFPVVVVVDTGASPPLLVLSGFNDTVNGSSSTVFATYMEGNGTSLLLFEYIVSVLPLFRQRWATRYYCPVNGCDVSCSVAVTYCLRNCHTRPRYAAYSSCITDRGQPNPDRDIAPPAPHHNRWNPRNRPSEDTVKPRPDFPLTSGSHREADRRYSRVGEYKLLVPSPEQPNSGAMHSLNAPARFPLPRPNRNPHRSNYWMKSTRCTTELQRIGWLADSRTDALCSPWNATRLAHEHSNAA